MKMWILAFGFALLALGNCVAVYLVARAMRGLKGTGSETAWTVMKRGFRAPRDEFTDDGWRHWHAAMGVQLAVVACVLLALLLVLHARA